LEVLYANTLAVGLYRHQDGQRIGIY